MTSWYSLGAGVLLAAALTACGGDSSDDNPAAGGEQVKTPDSLRLSFLSRYESGSFDTSAAEIPAYDAASQRLFVVNAEQGVLDVLDMSDPAKPLLIGSMGVEEIAAGAVVNSVAVKNGLVAIAVQAATKTDNGFAALYRADDLSLLGSVEVGAQPDMIIFTPDSSKVLTANEGEPSDDYQIDPPGSISIIDISNCLLYTSPSPRD